MGKREPMYIFITSQAAPKSAKPGWGPPACHTRNMEVCLLAHSYIFTPGSTFSPSFVSTSPQCALPASIHSCTAGLMRTSQTRWKNWSYQKSCRKSAFRDFLQIVYRSLVWRTINYNQKNCGTPSFITHRKWQAFESLVSWFQPPPPFFKG